MSEVGIATPKEFLTHIVDADMAEFVKEGECSLRSAYHACVSLLSLRDWIGTEHNAKTWTYKGQPIGTIDQNKLKAGFGADLVLLENDFEIVFDVANASKHMILTKGLTPLHGFANVYIQTVGGAFDADAFDPEAFQTTQNSIFVKVGTHYHDLLKCAQKVHAVWKVLFSENGW
jgi:hypothetical protein